MYCLNCHNFLITTAGQNTTCVYCGHVNPALPAQVVVPQVVAETPVTANGVRPGRRLNKKLIIIAAPATVLMVALVSFLIVQNVRASNRIQDAASQDKSTDYTAAQATLKVDLPFYILPATKNAQKKETQNNKKWLLYHTYQINAEALLTGKKYTEALIELNKIDKNYPSYFKVNSDILVATKAITVQKEDALKLAAAAAAAEAAKAEAQKTATAKAAATKKTSTTPVYASICLPSKPMSGQRHVDISAYKSVQNATSTAQIEQLMQGFFGQYGVTFEASSPTPDPQFIAIATLSYDKVTSADLCYMRNTSMTLIDEWSKYPVDWVKNSKLKTVVLDKNQKRVFSGATYSVAATYDVTKAEMWYDINYSGDYLREVIHHEYFHYLTYSYTFSVIHDAATWASYNKPGFTYGGGGASCYAPGNNCLTSPHPIPGFVTGYAASAEEEDQAEVYAYLMASTYYHFLKTWMPGDSYLTNKVNLQKSYIASHSASMSGAYFDNINP